jgi:hypothetical protein
MSGNPYEPPNGNVERDEGQYDRVFDEHWLGRECFAWFILMLALMMALNMLMRGVRYLLEVYENVGH